MEIIGDGMMTSTIKVDLDGLDAESDGILSGREAISALQHSVERLQEMIEARRQKERDRVVETREAHGADTTLWTYDVVDGEFARITECKTHETRLEIPSQIDGLPVLELGADACAFLEDTEEIVCSAGIQVVGDSAFRNCRKLRRLVLPYSTMTFKSGWVRQCRMLKDLVLPGMLGRIDMDVFEIDSIETLTLGVATNEVSPGAFAKSKLKELLVPEENPYFTCSGPALFTKDFTCLVTLVKPCESLEIAEGCIEIAPKAFACCSGLVDVALPSTLESIEAHAFSRCALREIHFPPSLKHIAQRAFYRCRALAQVDFNEGLEEIDEEAFAGTAISSVRLTSTLCQLSRNAFEHTDVVYAGPQASCVIAPGAKLHLDAYGGLYRKHEKGNELVFLMDTAATSYVVEDETRSIGPFAFARLSKLEEVRLPQGLESIGEGAFRSCTCLRRVSIPESLRFIREEAFYDTAIEEIYLPAAFESLGDRALVCAGARDENGTPSLHRVRVSPNCARFYVTGGLLCERVGDDDVRVVLYDGTRESVHVPLEVNEICPYAFANATNLHELYLNTHIRRVGNKALSVNCLIEHIHIDFEEPIEGHDEIDLHFPDTHRSIREISRGFDMATFISPEKMLARYDACVVNMHDFDAKNSSPVDLYDQAIRIFARLKAPLFLSANTKSMYLQIIHDNLEDMCEAIARHDDRDSIDMLVDLGFLNTETMLSCIERISKLQDAAMTGYMLEIKRRLFDGDALDFDL